MYINTVNSVCTHTGNVDAKSVVQLIHPSRQLIVNLRPENPDANQENMANYECTEEASAAARNAVKQWLLTLKVFIKSFLQNNEER